MLDHISIGVSDLERSIAFYDAALAPLGYERVYTSAKSAGYGIPRHDDAFSIRQDAAGDTRAGASFHVAFSAATREAVIGFYETAVALGAKPDGEPGLHPMYGDGYFAAFVLDPDGYRIEAVLHENAAPQFGAAPHLST